MNISGLTGLTSLLSLYRPAADDTPRRVIADPVSAKSADTATISQAARDLLANDMKALTSPSSGAQEASGKVSFDTDKGRVALDIGEYFSPGPKADNGELPPLLMPSQANIDALTSHVSAVFPKFLADHGIPYPPSSISYDNMGQPQFPPDYAYGEQLRQAFQESPAMANEIATTKALSDAKAALDDAVKFQEEYRRASSPQALQAVLSKYADLLSGNSLPAQSVVSFTPEGRISVAAVGTRIS